MADPLFQNVSAVRPVADDTFEIVGSSPGPAGAATVELPGGGLLSVDYAEPGQLVAYEFDGVASAIDPSLATIVGDRAVDRVRRYVEEPGNRPMRLQSPTRGQREPRGSLDPDREARVVGEVVVSADRAVDPDRSPTEQALAALDVAAQADGYSLDALREVGRVHADLAAELIGEAADDLAALAERDPTLLDEIATACRSLPDRDAGDRAIGALAEAIARREADADLWREAVLLDALTAPAALRLPPSRLRVEQIGGVWVVHPGPGEPGRWVRILRRADLGVVGVAPVLDHDREPTAEIVVPSHLDQRDVTITVTTEPFPAHAVDGLAGFAEAVRAGRRAADLEAIGRADRARVAWRRCAELWDALGDEDRARTAHRYAQDPERLMRRRPTLADRLVDTRS